MAVKVLLRCLALATLLATSLPATATGQALSCKDKIIKICNEDGENPVCKLLRASG